MCLVVFSVLAEARLWLKVFWIRNNWMKDRLGKKIKIMLMSKEKRQRIKKRARDLVGSALLRIEHHTISVSRRQEKRSQQSG